MGTLHALRDDVPGIRPEDMEVVNALPDEVVEAIIEASNDHIQVRLAREVKRLRLELLRGR